MTMNRIGYPYGEQVVKVRMDEIRALGFMPRDVEIVGVINAEPANPWVPKSDTTYLYLHIKSTVSFSRPDQAPLCIEPLFDFYDRYMELRTGLAQDLCAAISKFQCQQ